MSKDYRELYAVVENIEVEAYNRGYKDGKATESQTFEEGYKLGCKDAWKFNIECMKSHEVEEAFGVEDENVGFLCNQFDYEEALHRFRKWKEATSWEDVPVDDMSLEQARQAVKDLRKKLAESKENNDIDVLEVTLLSVEEAKKVSKEMRKSEYSWWLRSPGYDDCMAAFVFGGDGDVYGLGSTLVEFGVRPALKFKSSFFKKGDSFSYKGYEWDVIDDSLALCKSIVGKCAFNVYGNNNEYESSDIKKWLDDWWESKKEGTETELEVNDER